MPLFDDHASRYDGWFLKNRNVLQSEVLLLKRFLGDPPPVPEGALSVGCGSGLFERLLREEHGICISHGVEPSAAMAEVAAARGVQVEVATAEALPFEDGRFSTVLINGIAAYVDDLERVFAEAYRVLAPGGRLVAADVPAGSGYGLLYQLAAQLGGWDAPGLMRLAPADPYPVELVQGAGWRTTEEVAAALRAEGFERLALAQTLTTHARFSNDAVEQPVEGADRGGYVAIRAHRDGQGGAR